MNTGQTTKTAKTEKAAPRSGAAKRQAAPPNVLTKRLEQLRDEVKLDLHLARMEARDRLRELEPQIHHVEQLAEHLTEISSRAIGQIATEMKRFQDHLKQHRSKA